MVIHMSIPFSRIASGRMRSNFSCRIWHRRSQRFRDSCPPSREALRRDHAGAPRAEAGAVAVGKAARRRKAARTIVFTSHSCSVGHATAARSCLESRPLTQSAVMSKPDAEETKGGRPQLHQRRAQILEKAAQLFRVNGYE